MRVGAISPFNVQAAAFVIAVLSHAHGGRRTVDNVGDLKRPLPVGRDAARVVEAKPEQRECIILAVYRDVEDNHGVRPARKGRIEPDGATEVQSVGMMS